MFMPGRVTGKSRSPFTLRASRGLAPQLDDQGDDWINALVVTSRLHERLELGDDELDHSTFSIRQESLSAREAATDATGCCWPACPIWRGHLRDILPQSLRYLGPFSHLAQQTNTMPTVMAQGMAWRSSSKAYDCQPTLLIRATTSMPIASMAGRAR